VRLFAAVDLSADSRVAIAAEQRRMASALGPAGRSLKWVRQDNAHLTLLFLGHVDEERVPAVIVEGGRDINQSPFDITLAGIGMFPERGSPRVLWAGVGAGGENLVAVQRELSARIAACGVTLEDREFHPHLTLARWGASRPSDRARVDAAARPGILARQPVAWVTLYESRLLPAGAHYTALTRANLIGA
jgi:2'-5' RNA ligase